MRAARIFLSALVALYVALSAAFAFDQAILGENDRALQQMRADLDQSLQTLRRPNLGDDELAKLKSGLEQIRTTATERSLKLLAPLGELNQQVNSLGPAPAAGQSEDKAATDTRADLTAKRDRVQALKAQFDLTALAADQASSSITAVQRDRFFAGIFDRKRSILNPDLWYDTGVGFSMLFQRIGLLIGNWWSTVSPDAHPAGLLMIPAVFFTGIWGFRFLRRSFGAWLTRYASHHQPNDDMTRLWIIVRAVLAAFIGAVLLFVPIRFSLETSGYFTDPNARIIILWDAVLRIIVLSLLYYVIARRVASPNRPEIRIVDLDDRAATQFAFLAALTGFVARFNTEVGDIYQAVNVGINYTVGQSALGALALLILISIILLLLRSQEGLPNPDGRRLYFGWAANFVPFIWLLVIIGYGALLFGYIALADYLAHQIIRTSMVLLLVFLVYHLLDAAVTASFDPQSSFGTFLRRITGLSERAIERLGLVFRTVVDIVLVVAGVPLLLVLWTLNWVDLRSLLNTLSKGITIGDVTILPGTALIMLATLVCGVIATKLFNRWLDRRILSDTRINKGVQDSILKGSSYVGYFLAGLFALSAAGLDFSSLALAAGALGLGIGLGLQSIINNFVSGLILLAERPVRVGDWVSLPEGEGIVRRINVRSTEIETFDSCSIIMPNSALVTGAVKNWTHNDDMGRFTIDVTVDFDSDAEMMHRILIDTAKSHPKVLAHPAPTVLLTSFGKSGLEFVLRAFVADVLQASQVSSDIRFSLLKLFRENGITIAQPVTVLQTAKT